MSQYKEGNIEMHIESTGIRSCASSTWPASDSAPTQPGGWVDKNKQKRKRRIFFAVAQLLWQSQKLELDNLTIFFIFLTCDHCDWPDIISQVNKDYLKKIKLFRARASPSYCAVAFQMSQDLETDDPMWEQPSSVSINWTSTLNHLSSKGRDAWSTLYKRSTTPTQYRTSTRTI